MNPRRIAIVIACKASTLQLYSKLGPRLSVFTGGYYTSKAMAQEFGNKLAFEEAPGIWRAVKWRPAAQGAMGICEECGGIHFLWLALSVAEFAAIYGLK